MKLHEAPATRFVAGFMGAPAINLLPASAAGGRVAVAGVPTPLAAPRSGTPAEAGNRPEPIALADPSSAAFRGEVEPIERLGAETFACVRLPCPGPTLTLLLPGGIGRRAGEAVGLTPGWARVHLFAAAGDRLA